MTEELNKIMAGFEVAKIMASIHDKWRQKAAEFIMSQERYKDVYLVEQVLAIADDAAQAELQVHADYCEKMTALVELQERKNAAEKADMAVN
jgi:hypothetical protein